MSVWQTELKRQVAQVDAVPRDWKTVQQIADENGWGYSYAGQIVRAAQRAGRAEVKKWRVATAGCVRAVPHYRLKAEGGRQKA